VIKSRNIIWKGHTKGIREMKNLNKILVRKSEGKRQLARLIHRREKSIILK
jgi:hypothetical protein